ncbi:MAG: AraC family transcriptional regulator [Clostridiales bacterium]|jgi:AraC-like DNA-binding protein|nr:AraC family transcriptional regulator [Clostridiales bacterium]
MPNYLDCKEKRAHGTFDFPFAYYFITPEHPRYNMAVHWHNEYEIIRILSGELHLAIDDRRYDAKANDIYFVSKGMLHGATPNGCVYECLVFDLDSILDGSQICKKEEASIVHQEKLVQKSFPPSDDKIQQIARVLMDSMKARQSGYQFMVLGAIYSFLGIVLSHQHFEQVVNASNIRSRRLARLKKVLSLIKARYQDDLKLDDLASCADMNKQYFCRFFGEIMQRSPIDYLNCYRIEIACEHLSVRDMNISEIGSSCGFNDSSYFTKVFKKFKGITPSQYMKKQYASN